jgi:CRISPR-associated protein Cmr4
VRIDDDMKVVAKGALWTEESLPAETILAGIVQCERVFQKNGASDNSIKSDDLLKQFTACDPEKPLVLQIGGKATVGRGQMRCVFTEVK